MMGTIGGLVIGLITEYFTSHSFVPVRELATACKSGTAVNIIFGMALGYKSCIIPVFTLASAIYVSFMLCDLYGIALAALGMLSTLATGLTIGSAALVSLALYGAFVVRLEIRDGVNVLEPVTFSFLLVGSMIPYWFAALTMKSVGKAANEMVEEVNRQFEKTDEVGLTILSHSKTIKPDYDSCITISTKSSLKEMIAPGALVIGAPLVA